MTVKTSIVGVSAAVMPVSSEQPHMLLTNVQGFVVTGYVLGV